MKKLPPHIKRRLNWFDVEDYINTLKKSYLTNFNNNLLDSYDSEELTNSLIGDIVSEMLSEYDDEELSNEEFGEEFSDVWSKIANVIEEEYRDEILVWFQNLKNIK